LVHWGGGRQAAFQEAASMHLCRLSRRARGFTLIELLLVIAIIMVMLSLIIGVAMKGTAWVYQRNTELTFRKVNDRLIRHMDNIRNDARQWSTPTAILAQANGDTQRAETLKIKYLTKWSFPATYNEAQTNYFQSIQLYGPSGYHLAAGIYQQMVQNLETPALATSLTAAQQNAALLLIVFERTKGSSPDELAPSEIAGQDSNATVPANTTRDHNRWLVDAWGSPLMYLRYSTLDVASTSLENPNLILAPIITPAFNAWLIEKANLHYKAKQGADADDPNNTLRDLTWLSQPTDNRAAWQLGPPFPVIPVAPAPPSAPLPNNLGCFQFRFFHNPTAGVYAPLVLFSAGPDRNYTTLYDNINSYGLQLNVSQGNN
jgi:prepilin-type N-terminal cleavage/methylation domain-containing protein